MFSLLFALVAALFAVTAADSNTLHQQQYCDIPITSKRHYQWPLAFKPNTDDLYPTTKIQNVDGTFEVVVRVAADSEVVLSCGPNYLKHFDRQDRMLVRCNGDTGNFTALPSNVVYDITKVTCDLRVIEEVLVPMPDCSNNHWTASAFGYMEPSAQQSLLIGEACYEESKGLTRFAHVKLGAKPFLRKESNTYLTKNIHPETSRYKIDLFRHLHFDELYARLRQSLQLKNVPHFKLTQYIDELLLSTAQLSAVKKLGWNYFVAYDELNTLLAIKSDIQQLSTQKAIDVYVGSHGVKTLTSANGVDVPIYVGEQRFPVPAYIWLLVQHQDKATVFVVTNTDGNAIGETTSESSKPLCTSKCSQVSWLSSSMQLPGLLCCAVEDAQRLIEEIPTTISAQKMLL